MPIRNPQALRQAYETLHLRSSGSVETNNEELEQQNLWIDWLSKYQEKYLDWEKFSKEELQDFFQLLSH